MEPEQCYEAFRLELLRYLDEHKEIQRKQFAEAAGIAPSTFTQILKGDRTGPEDRPSQIARMIGLSYEEMIRIGCTLMTGGKPEGEPLTCPFWEKTRPP